MTMLATALMLATTAVPAAAQAKAEIWAMEQSIYAGRSKGDLRPYLDTLATGYVSWPPFDARPKGEDGLQATARKMAGKTQEKLDMELLDFTLNGDTAIIYYHTHRTRLADGTPADEWWEATHTWVREGGHWKVLGGMARRAPARP
jgi:ketosteroid isomerase-like protein